MALAIMIAPTMFSQESILAPPEPLKGPFAKGVEAMALGFLLLWLIRHRWMPRFTLPMVMATLFVSWSALSGFWCEDSIGYRSQINKLVHSFATTFALYVVIRTRRDIEHVLVVWKLMSFAYAFLMVLELYVPKSMLPKMTDDLVIEGISFHRCNGPSGHSNWAGFFLGATMCLQPYFWIRYRTLGARAILAAITMMELYALVAAHVRLGVLGLAVGSMWWIARGGYGSRLKPIGLCLLAGILAWPILPETWKARTLDAETLANDHSIEVRMALQEECLRLAVTYAGLGTGYGGYGYLLFTRGSGYALDDHLGKINKEGYETRGRQWIGTFGTHNAYLEVMIETGVFGLLLIVSTGLVLYLGLFAAGHRNRGDLAAQQMGLVLESMLLSLSAMLLVLHAQERRVLWTLFAVGSSYIALTRNNQMGGESNSPIRVPGGALRFTFCALLTGCCLVALTLLAKHFVGFEDGEW